MAFHKIIQESNVRCVCGHWVLLDVTITVQISRIQKSLIAVVSGVLVVPAPPLTQFGGCKKDDGISVTEREIQYWRNCY